jgi:hypothetical protein
MRRCFGGILLAGLMLAGSPAFASVQVSVDIGSQRMKVFVDGRFGMSGAFRPAVESTGRRPALTVRNVWNGHGSRPNMPAHRCRIRSSSTADMPSTGRTITARWGGQLRTAVFD